MSTPSSGARRQLVSSAEAVPASRQHTRPCGDCPWARRALPGWLGRLTSADWVRAVLGESRIDCHTHIGPQCAGAAIFRGNLCKRPRDPLTLRLPADRDAVFATPAEFTSHHAEGPHVDTEAR